MTPEQITDALRGQAKRIAREIPQSTWYLFGSASRDIEGPGDVDVLVLSHDHDASTLVRETLTAAELPFPLHLLLLTVDEEEQLGFIGSQRCILIFPLE